MHRPRLDEERLVAMWARLEVIGLQLTGCVLVVIGVALLLAAARGSPEFRFLVGSAGLALALAGILAALQMREDVVTGATAGIVTAWFAVILVVVSPTTSAQVVADDLLVPAIVGGIALAIRVFRGGFRVRSTAGEVR